MSDKKKIAIYLVLFLVGAYLMPVAKNWTPSFSQKHNWPYGAEVTRDVWQDLFNTNITDADLPIWNTLRDNDFSTQQLYVLFDGNISFDSLDRTSLLSFVNEGNAAFIAAHNFDFELLDTLNVDMEYAEFELATITNGIGVSTYEQDFYDSRDSSYQFTTRNYSEYFTAIDSVESQMVGIAHGSENDHLTYLKVPFGEGEFYLFNQPLLLTNYYVLSDEGKRYLERLTSYMPSYDIIWDESHKQIKQMTKASPLHIVLGHSALRWAYWLAFAGIGLLFLFRVKRRQRIIPIVEPPTNDSVDFTKTMGSLFFNTANNKTIAMKKIAILKEYLSREMYLRDIDFNQSEVMSVVNKSDHSKDEVEKLFELVKTISNSQSVSYTRLKLLNKMINRLMGKRMEAKN